MLEIARPDEGFIKGDRCRVVSREAEQPVCRLAILRCDRLFNVLDRVVGAAGEPALRRAVIPRSVRIEAEPCSLRKPGQHVIEQTHFIRRITHAHLPFERAKTRLRQGFDALQGIRPGRQ